MHLRARKGCIMHTRNLLKAVIQLNVAGRIYSAGLTKLQTLQARDLFTLTVPVVFTMLHGRLVIRIRAKLWLMR